METARLQRDGADKGGGADFDEISKSTRRIIADFGVLLRIRGLRRGNQGA
jgi:hypothetical protein